MLGEFIVTHRDAIIANARVRVEARRSPKATEAELTSGIPIFLDQLAEALHRAGRRDVGAQDEFGRSAIRHAQAVVGMGLPVAQVVHDYGDICQAITQVALGHGLRVPTEDFKSLNLCLDDAIAAAVTEFGELRARNYGSGNGASWLSRPRDAQPFEHGNAVL